VTPLEDGFCHVSLTADISAARNGVLGGSATMVGIGLVGGGVLAALNAIWILPLVPVLGGLGAAFGVSRIHRPRAERTLLGLERALDYVEGAVIKPSHQLPSRTPGLLEMITTEMRKAISSGTFTPPQRKRRD
jgi:hypothetical protein